MRRWRLIIVSLLIVLPGCFLNPYSSDFKCSRTDNGQCLSVSTAYEESLNNEPDSRDAKQKSINGDKDTYQRELYKKLTGMIKSPTTPLVVPPTVMRGLALTFADDEKDLFSYQYVFFFTDDPSWVFGDYLNSGVAGEGK